MSSRGWKSEGMFVRNAHTDILFRSQWHVNTATQTTTTVHVKMGKAIPLTEERPSHLDIQPCSLCVSRKTCPLGLPTSLRMKVLSPCAPSPSCRRGLGGGLHTMAGPFISKSVASLGNAAWALLGAFISCLAGVPLQGQEWRWQRSQASCQGVLN